ncbi:hypothetical protein BDN71DRAFT_1452279 [Pleurotus eryngii]|uniref:Secreted protein n=1 Tax=Pleurotus eryngii TaxID=5323 RepID=A0A9P5ZQN5_PLEER|nr:hypothetical protein BDN71DRAFT_1452279 [Pleurotus eryngii]
MLKAWRALAFVLHLFSPSLLSSYPHRQNADMFMPKPLPTSKSPSNSCSVAPEALETRGFIAGALTGRR